MSLVTWLGIPDHWTPPAISLEESRWVLAATEDALPDVVRLMDKRHISPRAALNAVDRYRLRRELPSGFNPSWSSFTYTPRVAVKAPASSGSSGVHILELETPENAVVSALRKMLALPEELTGVVEEFIDGEAIELSGVKFADRVFFFHPLRQYWTVRPLSDVPYIERYERVFDHWWLYNETADALRYIGIDNSAFCVEWRVTGYRQAKIVEINPRPGDDDKGYFEALWDRPIADQIEEWAQDVYHAESPETALVTAQATHG